MFQKDYWQMLDEQLTELCAKYHIDCFVPATIGYKFDRHKAITGLLVRDNALRTKVTTVLSILALVLSIAAFIKSFFVQH